MVWNINIRALADPIAWWALVLAIGALPFLVVPVPWVAVAQAKMAIISTAVLIASLAWTAARISEGHFSIPRSLIGLAGALIPIAYAISAFLYGGSASFVGGRGEQDTLVAVILFYALLVLPSLVFANQFRGITASLRALYIGSAAAAVQSLLLLLPEAGALGALSERAFSVVGSLHDLGIFLGLIVFISSALLAFRVFDSWWRIFTGAVGGLSFVALLLICTRSADVWYALAAIAFTAAFFQLRIVRARHEGRGGILRRAGLWIALGIAGLAVGCGGAFVYDHLPARFQIVQAEVRPSWQGTFAVGERALDTTPALLFGSGPNTFSHVWGHFKPEEVNSTLFWDADFASGVGAIPTSVVTVGFVGAAAWAILAFLALLRFVALVRTRDTSFPLHGLSFAVAGASVYLMAFHVMYAPGLALSSLTFVFLGLLSLSQANTRSAPLQMPLSVEDWRGASRLALLLAVAGVCAYASITALRAVASDALITRGAFLYSQSQDVSDAVASVRLALAVYPRNDRGERAAVELGLLQLKELAARSDGSSEARVQLQAALSQTVGHGLAAVTLDPGNYRNWLILAQLYQHLAGAGVQGASEGARDAFMKAIEANPKNPTPFVNLAQLAVAEGRSEEATDFLDQALALKPDLASALHLRSQIHARAGDMDRAKADAEAVVKSAPDDPLAWYNLGAVRYAASSYEEAIEALARAIELQDDYANALFVQALSFEKIGKRADALRALERIAALNPDDASVKGLVATFKAGKPIDSAFPR